MNIAINGSHNASIVVEDNGEIVLVLELERFLNLKNSGLATYNTPKGNIVIMEHVVKWIREYLGVEKFDTCYRHMTHTYKGSHLSTKHPPMQLPMCATFIPADEYHPSFFHHHSHAAGALYQSPFSKALIFSFDGTGDDGDFLVFLGDKEKENSIELLERVCKPGEDTYKDNFLACGIPGRHGTVGEGFPEGKPDFDLGFAYMIFGHFIDDIRQEPEGIGMGNLVYPGKLMGLAGYGVVREEWIEPFMEFYKSDAQGGTYKQRLEVLSSKTGLVFDEANRLKGQEGWDVAATSQHVFEECFLEIAKPYLEQYPELPVCMAGGCALNIILNTRLVEEFGRTVFVGPVPNDSGIALGQIAMACKPEKPYDITYKGLPILDEVTVIEYFREFPNTRQLTYEEQDKWDGVTQVPYKTLIDDIIDGKIIGVVRDRSEVGPRALGNRSILWNPSSPDMKNILNKKVKDREWYRPFAPVVRLEDVEKFFHWKGESRWMSFCPKVRDEWKEQLSAIVHIDGTARLQTVTEEQNPWLYYMLTELDKKTGAGVLLNTSFNVNGKPILSTVKDAVHIYKTTEMDGLVINDLYIRKEPFNEEV